MSKRWIASFRFRLSGNDGALGGAFKSYGSLSRKHLRVLNHPLSYAPHMAGFPASMRMADEGQAAFETLKAG